MRDGECGLRHRTAAGPALLPRVVDGQARVLLGGVGVSQVPEGVGALAVQVGRIDERRPLLLLFLPHPAVRHLRLDDGLRRLTLVIELRQRTGFQGPQVGKARGRGELSQPGRPVRAAVPRPGCRGGWPDRPCPPGRARRARRSAGSAPARQVSVLLRSRGSSSSARYSRNPRRCAGVPKRSSNRAAYASSGPGASGHGSRFVISGSPGRS